MKKIYSGMGGSIHKGYLKDRTPVVKKETLIKDYSIEKRFKNDVKTLKMWNNLLSSKNASFFPKLINSGIEKSRGKPDLGHYTIPYYELPTLENAIENKLLNKKEAKSAILQSLEFLWGKVYKKSIQNTPKDYFQKCYVDTVNHLMDNVAKKNRLFLNNFQEMGNVELKVDWEKNSTRICGLKETLKKINKEKKKIIELMPNKIHIIHGDVHPGNIFYDSEKKYNKKANIIFFDFGHCLTLINKKGILLGDPAFDMEKFQSFLSGELKAIREKNMSLTKRKNEFKLNIKKKKEKNELNEYVKKIDVINLSEKEGLINKNIDIEKLKQRTLAARFALYTGSATYAETKEQASNRMLLGLDAIHKLIENN